MLIKKLLFEDKLNPCVCSPIMDNPFIPGLLVSSKSPKGRGKPERHRGFRWHPDPVRKWDSSKDLHYGFAKCLVEAAVQHTGQGELLEVVSGGIKVYFKCGLEKVEAFVMNPKEAELWGYSKPENEDDPWIPPETIDWALLHGHEHYEERAAQAAPVYALSALPPQSIFALGRPEYVGCYTHYGSTEDNVKGEFCVVPSYVHGVIRRGDLHVST